VLLQVVQLLPKALLALAQLLQHLLHQPRLLSRRPRRGRAVRSTCTAAAARACAPGPLVAQPRHATRRLMVSMSRFSIYVPLAAASNLRSRSSMRRSTGRYLCS
jgi:hypothetical protein